MLTDFQKSKITHLFHVYDADQKGYLTIADYDRTAHNLVELRGWLKDSPAYIRAYEFSEKVGNWCKKMLIKTTTVE